MRFLTSYRQLSITPEPQPVDDDSGLVTHVIFLKYAITFNDFNPAK